MKSRLKTSFRIYQNNNSIGYSSFFDLIDGDNETKQTKGLAYLFAKFPQLVILLLKYIACLTKKKLPSSNEIDYVQVDAEMLSVGIDKIRRDITLALYQGDVKKYVIVIEAKSVKVGSLKNNIIKQLTSYLDPAYFPSDTGVPRIGITLTKYTVLHSRDTGFISMTWNEIMILIRKFIFTEKNNKNDITIAVEYLEFLTGVKKGMNFFEVEVLSVAAGKTHGLTKKHFVHACPHNVQGFSYKTPIFITFRADGGGEMEYLYKIKNIVVLDPFSPSLDLILEGIDYDFACRIKGYITDRKNNGFGFNHEGEDYRFYNLSNKDAIHLKHLPKPKKNNVGARYYTIAELLKGEKIVEVASQN